MLKILVRNAMNTFQKHQKITRQSIGKHLRETKANKAKKSKGRQIAHSNTTNTNMSRQWSAAVSMENKYKLLSYNILAQDLLLEHYYLYQNQNPDVLRWSYRMQKLCNEIVSLNPDIICLQEMQYNHVKAMVRNIQGKRKLEYVFKKKTGTRTDGCVIIYDKDKFKLVEDQGVEFHKSNDVQLNREQIALMAKFELREDPTKLFIVATTHLLYNPKRDDVRMAQVKLLLMALHEFSYCQNKNNLPILLSGDFNSPPHSSPIQLLTTPMDFTQAAATTNANNGEAEIIRLEMRALSFGQGCASTYQNDWVTVDFILHSVAQNREKIKIWSIYKLPTIRACNVNVGCLPNEFLGSDHFSQAIVFSVP